MAIFINVVIVDRGANFNYNYSARSSEGGRNRVKKADRA